MARVFLFNFVSSSQHFQRLDTEFDGYENAKIVLINRFATFCLKIRSSKRQPVTDHSSYSRCQIACKTHIAKLLLSKLLSFWVYEDTGQIKQFLEEFGDYTISSEKFIWLGRFYIIYFVIQYFIFFHLKKNDTLYYYIEKFNWSE